MADLGSSIGWIAGGVGVVAAFITALSSFRKTGSEKTGLLVDAASDVVVIQKGAIEDLRKGLDEATTRIAALEADKLAATWEAAKLRAENDLLVQRVKHLEAEVKHLQAQLITERQMDLMDKRLTKEEGRNTDIEKFAADQAKKQAVSEERADDTKGHA